MARMQKTGWNACEELKKEKIKNERILEELKDEEEGKRRPGMHQSQKVKNLTRATRNEMPAIKAKIRENLPTLQSTEIRRFKIPYHEAVILELEEENLQVAADYLRRLFQLDDDLRTEAGVETTIWQKPWLKDQKELIDLLRNGLTNTNRAKHKRELVTEATAFLEVALSFESKTWEWWWIAEELYKSALETSKRIKSDNGQMETVLNYLYGRLLQKMNKFESSLEYLIPALNKSRKESWNASKILGTKQKSIFTETCVLLHKSYLVLGKELRKDNPEKAVKTCLRALETAQDSDREEYIANALYELGKCELNVGNTKEALHNFSKYLALMKRLENPEGICKAHKQLAFSYKQIKDDENTMKHFQLFKDIAAEYELPYKLAQAYFFTGEYLLNQGKAKLSTPYLEYSFSLYRSLKDIKNCDKARCLAGVSKGQEIMESYINLILDCGNKNSKAIEKLCKWKNSREPFWCEEKSGENLEEESLSKLEDQTSKTVDSLLSIFSEASTNSSIKLKSREENEKEFPIQAEVNNENDEILNLQEVKQKNQNQTEEIHIH